MSYKQRAGIALVLLAIWGQNTLRHNPIVSESLAMENTLGFLTGIFFISGLFIFLVSSNRNESE